MTNSAASSLRSTTRWGRSTIGGLLRRRRTQLLFAVLFGAILGGGFVAAVSTGLGSHDHFGPPFLSSVHQPGHGWMNHLGDGGVGR